MNRKRKNYYAVLQLNFNDATITDALIRRRMSEMAYKMTRQEFAEMYRVMMNPYLRSLERQDMLSEARDKAYPLLQTYERWSARVPEPVAKKAMDKIGYPMDLFRTIWGMETEPWDENECGNCHHYLAPGEQFCSHCGTRRGEGSFSPELTAMACIYGPCPIERYYHCRDCGNQWQRIEMLDSENYCPRCGSCEIDREEGEFL